MNNMYDEESVANMLYEMDTQQLRYLLSVIEGLLTSEQLFTVKPVKVKHFQTLHAEMCEVSFSLQGELDIEKF